MIEMKGRFIEWVVQVLPMEPVAVENCRISIHQVTIHKLDNEIHIQRIQNEINNGQVDLIINNLTQSKNYKEKFQMITPRKNR